MTLPERPGLLHAVPVLDIVGLLALLLLLVPSLVRQTGVTVELPPSRFQLERYQRSFVITLGLAQGGPSIHFGRDLVDREELVRRLDEIVASDGAGDAMVLLRTDAGTSVGTEREISELVLAKGFRLALVGAEPGESPAKPEPAE